MGAAGAVGRLFQGVAGEHAEDHRYAGIAGRFGHTARTFAGHIIEMRRATADDGAQGDDGFVVAGLGKLAGSKRRI